MNLTAAHHTLMREMIRRRLGIEVPDQRTPELDKAAADGASVLGVTDPSRLLSQLDSMPLNAPAWQKMIPRLTINETHFFRNRPQMEAIRTHILPALIDRNRGRRTLRVWSAGCSSGEEPYSIAMMLDTLLPDRAAWKIDIIGTDLDPVILEKARAGVYGSWSFREVPADMKQKYFTEQGDRFSLAPHIRSMVKFSQLNLVSDTFPSRPAGIHDIDLLLCRNVLIYFNEDTVRKIVDRFHSTLSDAGWLVVGHAEPSTAIFGKFTAHNRPGTVLYQKPSPGTAAPVRPGSAPPGATTPAGRLSTVPGNRQAPLQPSGPASAGSSTRMTAADAERALRDPARRAEAERALAQQARTSRGDGQPAYLLARHHMRRRAYPDAVKWATDAVTAQPLFVAGHYVLGLAAVETGDLDQALQSLRRCVFLDDNFALGHYALADVLSKTGNPHRAVKELEAAETAAAGHPATGHVPEGEGMTYADLKNLISLKTSTLKF